MTLADVAAVVPVAVLRDNKFLTLGFLSDPQPMMLTFIDGPAYVRKVAETNDAVCVLTTEALARDLGTVPGVAVCADPRRAFFDLHNHLTAETEFYGPVFPTVVDPTARVHPTAFVAERNIRIGPHAVIGPHVSVMERCTIGAAVTIWPGVVLGSVGFQVTRRGDAMVDMLHAGGIVIRDRAQILSNAVVATAVFRQTTTVGEDARIGNLAFLSHNVQVGPRSFIGHGATVNGNVRIGVDVWVGPGATISNNITLADGAIVSLGATVTKDVASGQRVTGMLAIDHVAMLRHLASFK